MSEITKEMYIAAYIKKHQAADLAAYATPEVLGKWTPTAVLKDKYSDGYDMLIRSLMKDVDWVKVKDQLLMETLEKVAEQ